MQSVPGKIQGNEIDARGGKLVIIPPKLPWGGLGSSIKVAEGKVLYFDVAWLVGRNADDLTTPNWL